ncbi:hypothetical protein [uncultured Alteromonas sp.]|jgi:hypothetical protein|uniref:hypothetical protein n=1 Tax=uncultured Alteromonas sp. TaxID=179113 RepID=UPI0025FCCE6C|nr:hypothetical protein [uncultured Alteromonas sp.]
MKQPLSIKIVAASLFLPCVYTMAGSEQLRARHLNTPTGVLPTGSLNAITDLTVVKVGH